MIQGMVKVKEEPKYEVPSMRVRMCGTQLLTEEDFWSEANTSSMRIHVHVYEGELIKTAINMEASKFLGLQ